MKLLQNKVIKNASWIIGGQILKTIIAIVISLLTARYLGPSNYGIINYASSIVAFVTPIMYLGFNNTLVQEIINNPKDENKVVGSAILLSFISSLFCIAGIFAFTMIANKGETITIIVCVLYSVILVFQSIDLVGYWFQAKLLSKYSSIVSIIAYVIVSIYRIILLATNKSIIWFSVASAFDVLLISIGLLILFNRISNSHLRFSFKFAIKMLSRSKYYIVSNLMIVLFAQTDRIMLKLLVDSSSVGYYTAATTCAGFIGMFFVAVIDSMRPVILKYKNTNNILYENSLVSLYCVVIYISLAYSVIVTISAPLMIDILYGESYYSAIPVLQVIVWYGTFSYLGGARDIWILAENKQKHLIVLNIFGAIVNIVLNFILIPIYSTLGAAIATVITQFSVNIVFVSVYKPTRHNGHLILKSLNPKCLKEFFH